MPYSIPATLMAMQLAVRPLHAAKVCFIPVPANDHRPLVLRHGPLSFFTALLLVAKIVALTIVAVTPAPAELSTITNDRILQLTNAERTKVGLPALKMNSLLNNAAAQKAQDMLANDYFAHISPTGVTPWFWMKKVGYSYRVAGENLAIDFTEAEDVVAAWMASPTHKENILLPEYTETGVAVATGEFQGGTSTVVVHMFGLPAQAKTPVPTATPGVKAIQSRPSPTPTPSSTPGSIPTTVPTPPPDVTPPRVPRIAIQPNTLVTTTIPLSISGDAGSTVHLLFNNQLTDLVTIPSSGELTYTSNLTGLPDGPVTIVAYASDDANNVSQLSPAVSAIKNSQQATLMAKDIAIWLSPQTDTNVAMAVIPHQANGKIVIQQADHQTSLEATDYVPLTLSAAPIAIAVADAAGNQSQPTTLTVAPQFSTDFTAAYQAPPARFSAVTRQLAASLGITLLILLSVAVVIRIKIQHPLLIAHASFVIILAAILTLF